VCERLVQWHISTRISTEPEACPFLSFLMAEVTSPRDGLATVVSVFGGVVFASSSSMAKCAPGVDNLVPPHSVLSTVLEPRP